jgi:hypothetical protein
VTISSRDALLGSSCHRAIQTGIGEALRTRLVPMEPASDRIFKALQALDHEASGADEQKPDGQEKREK